KLHEEVDRVLAGRVPEFEDLPQLKDTEAVFLEALRLYPPAGGIGRRALEDYPIGEDTIPKGSGIFFCPDAIPRGARVGSDLEKFSPEGWLDPDTTRPKFSYFPFGGGTRVCIGERFAMMEGILVLTAIAQHWRLRLEPGHRVAMQPRITLRAKYGMRMTVE